MEEWSRRTGAGQPIFRWITGQGDKVGIYRSAAVRDRRGDYRLVRGRGRAQFRRGARNGHDRRAGGDCFRRRAMAKALDLKHFRVKRPPVRVKNADPQAFESRGLGARRSIRRNLSGPCWVHPTASFAAPCAPPPLRLCRSLRRINFWAAICPPPKNPSPSLWVANRIGRRCGTPPRSSTNSGSAILP